MQEGSLFSTPSPAFIVGGFFDDDHLLTFLFARDRQLFEGMFRPSQLLFPKLLAILLLSEEGIDLALVKIRFEILPFSPSPHPRDLET